MSLKKLLHGASEVKTAESVYYLGFIDDEDLAKVYNLASCFVFPSFYEGFGLPPLEAMACSTPVISSNLSSMPEICAEAALYCNPHDIHDIANKIQILLKDTVLQDELENMNPKIKKALIFLFILLYSLIHQADLPVQLIKPGFYFSQLLEVIFFLTNLPVQLVYLPGIG